VDDKGRAVVVQQVNDFDKSIADATALDKILFVIELAGKTARRAAHHRFDFRDGAAMLCGALDVERDPTELVGRGHWLFYTRKLFKRRGNSGG